MWSAIPPFVLSTVTAQFVFDLEWVLLALALMGLLVGGFAVAVWVKREHGKEQPLTGQDRLSHYRALVEQGLLKPEEFEKIRGNLEKPPPPPAP